MTMTAALPRDIETWESEGGATPDSRGASAASMSGTASQVEWAERIKRQVNTEFDRVAASFRSLAAKQVTTSARIRKPSSRYSRISELK